MTYYPAAGAMRINSTLYYILKDHLGSASVVTDASGNVTGEQRYYPFGETRVTTGTIYTDKLFTRQREITGLGIYHFNARFYSPKLGRFLSADTIVPGYGNPQNLNRFSYVTNNPLRYNDPTGHNYCDLITNQNQEDCEGGESNFATSENGGYNSGGNDGGNDDGPDILVPASDDGGLDTFVPVSGGGWADIFVLIFGNDGPNTFVPADIELSVDMSKADRKLSPGEIELLKRNGYDIHDLKGGKSASKKDLFKDKNGNIFVKPKDGSGPGEPLNININNLGSV